MHHGHHPEKPEKSEFEEEVRDKYLCYTGNVLELTIYSNWPWILAVLLLQLPKRWD